MEISDAVNLIKVGLSERIPHSTWAELGCGSGTFTKALANLLGNGSKIYAIDKDHQLIPAMYDAVKIEFIKVNFEDEPLPRSNLDGILMANSLHYIKDKLTFARKIIATLKTKGQLIIVEYNRENPNPWVPYPVSFAELKDIFSAVGFHSIEKIGERNSVYGPEKMYACTIQQSRK